MFRKSSSSTISSLSSTTSCRSSYSSGTASIIVHQQPISIKTPPRTTSLNFRQIIHQSPPSSFLSLLCEDEFEVIDLVEDDNTSSCDNKSSSRTSSAEDLTIDNMSSVIAAAIQLSASGGKNPSSLSSGNASIIRHKSTTNNSKKKENRFSRNLLRWSTGSNIKNSKRSSVMSLQQTEQAKFHFDDGKEELINRGIRVKEIRSTLDPIVVVSTEMDIETSIPSLQRPTNHHIHVI